MPGFSGIVAVVVVVAAFAVAVAVVVVVVVTVVGIRRCCHSPCHSLTLVALMFVSVLMLVFLVWCCQLLLFVCFVVLFNDAAGV